MSVKILIAWFAGVALVLLPACNGPANQKPVPEAENRCKVEPLYNPAFSYLSVYSVTIDGVTHYIVRDGHGMVILPQ